MPWWISCKTVDFTVKWTSALTTYGKIKYTENETQHMIRCLHRKKSLYFSCVYGADCKPPTDHLPTTYWPLTDHLPTTNRPLTDHLPTTYRPLTNHLWPPTDHLPTTYQPLFYSAVCSRLPNFWYKVLKQDLSSWKGWHFQLVSNGFRNIMWLQDFFLSGIFSFFLFSVCILSAVFVESQPIHHQLLHSYNTAHVWDS